MGRKPTNDVQTSWIEIEIGDKVQIDPNVGESLTIEGNKRLGQGGLVLEVKERRPTYNGRTNDLIAVQWPDGDIMHISTYWLTREENLEMDIAILKWRKYFDN